MIKTRFLDQCIEKGIALLYIVSSKTKNVRTVYIYINWQFSINKTFIHVYTNKALNRKSNKSWKYLASVINSAITNVGEKY